VVDFSIFPTVTFEGAPPVSHAVRCSLTTDTAHPASRSRYISYFNWERMQSLDMAGMMLYKRFSSFS